MKRNKPRIGGYRAQYITVDGVTRSMSDWSLRLGGNPTLVLRRLKLGWSERDAVTVPPKGRRPQKPKDS